MAEAGSTHDKPENLAQALLVTLVETTESNKVLTNTEIQNKHQNE